MSNIAPCQALYYQRSRASPVLASQCVTRRLPPAFPTTSRTSAMADGQTMIQRGYSHAREEHKQIVEDKDKQQLNYLVNQPDRRDSRGSKQAGGVL